MAKQNLVKIAGIDVSSKRMSVQIRDEYQDKISSAVIVFRFDVNQLITLSKFQSVVIWENYSGTLETDSNRRFIGEIRKIEKDVGTIKITCFGELSQAITGEVNQTFDRNIDTEAGEGSEIFITLAGLSGLTADSTSVVATGTSNTDIVIDKFVCKNAEPYERMQTLADIYDYQFYFRPSVSKVFFEPRGFALNSNVIQIGGTGNNVQGFPKLVEDSTKLFNRVEVKGAFDEIKKTESFNGTGSQTDFTLSFEPEIVTVTVDGTEQIGGVEGSTSTFDYTVDKSNKKIVFASGSIPGAGASNVVILYSYRQERSVFRNNESSISELGRVISSRFTFKDIESVDDAEKRGDKLLEVYSDEFITTKLKVKPLTAEEFGLEAGQKIRVVYDRYDFDIVMVIKTMITRFPENDVELSLGDKEVRVASMDFDNSKRLKRIEEELAKGSTFVVESKDIPHTLTSSRRDIRVNQQDYDFGSNSLILGLGIPEGFPALGTGLLGSKDDAFDPEEEHTINQTNNIYDEDFDDQDYEDTSTATGWGTGSINFTSGQIAQSSSIFLNDGIKVSALLTPTEVSGSFTYELTADYLSPIAHYKMNDNLATTDVIDSMGSFNGSLEENGIEVNTEDYSVVGKINNAINLPGTRYYDTGIPGYVGDRYEIKVTDNSLTFNYQTDFSFGLWAKTGATEQASNSIALMGYNFKLALEIEAGKFRVGTRNGDGATIREIISTVNALDNVYHHVFCTYDSSTTILKLYVDGNFIDSIVSDNLFDTGTTDLSIGQAVYGGNTQSFTGDIDDVRVYNKALSASEISSIYNSGNGTEENANWENVTPNVRHFFTNTGNDVRFRAIENSASTGEISKINIEVFA